MDGRADAARALELTNHRSHTNQPPGGGGGIIAIGRIGALDGNGHQPPSLASAPPSLLNGGEPT